MVQLSLGMFPFIDSILYKDEWYFLTRGNKMYSVSLLSTNELQAKVAKLPVVPSGLNVRTLLGSVFIRESTNTVKSEMIIGTTILLPQLSYKPLSMYTFSPHTMSWVDIGDLPISEYLSSTTLPTGELVIIGKVMGKATKVFISRTECKCKVR